MNITQLRQDKIISDFDYRLARRLTRLGGDTQPEVLVAVALISKGVQDGHVCLDLQHLNHILKIGSTSDRVIDLPDISLYRQILGVSPLVGDGSVPTPLVLEDDRLYFHRYWQYEHNLAQELLKRSKKLITDIDENLLSTGLKRFFPHSHDYNVTDQKHGAKTAVLRHLTIISGGPGTGKTTTVTAILALLAEQGMAHDQPLTMLLLAPTGKGAARLSQSIRNQIKSLNLSDQIKDAIPRQATTIHRALGYLPRTPTRFHYNRQNPLAADVVVLDEASMVDIALMAKLVDAVPEKSRLVILGDHNQLASIEAGSILGNICQPAYEIKPHGIGASVTYLTTSFRFNESEGIGRLTSAVRDGDYLEAINVLQDEHQPQVILKTPEITSKVSKTLCVTIINGYRHYLQAENPVEALELFEQFQILSAHRYGFGGVKHLNDLTEELLILNGLLPSRQDWYKGRPIMITSNDYNMRLFNGDIGLLWPDQGSNNELRVFFPGGTDNELRIFAPQLLPHHQTVFAMTIHKSQGSEFNQVAIVLPEVRSPVLSRELLYTAISRARNSLTIFAEKNILKEMINHTIKRNSGLYEKLCRT